MVLKMVYEPGDVIYYPKLHVMSDKPMKVQDYFMGMGKNGPYVQYLTPDLMPMMIKEMHENVENHYDNLCVVVGPEGSGKSNCAYWICKNFDPDFDIKEGYIYDIGPWLEKLTKGEVRGKVFWFDEATNIASNRDWMKDSNKSLIQLLEMLRSYGMTLVMCIPKLERLDVYIRETRMRYLVSCADRVWDIDTERKRGYFELKRWPRFHTVCWGTFPKMPTEESSIYELLKSKSQKEKADEIYERYQETEHPNKKKQADRERKLAWMLIRKGCSYQEIEEETEIPQSTLRRWMTENRREEDE